VALNQAAPASTFEQTMRFFFRMLGLPLGLPLELTLLDWEKSNYSQSRAVLEQAKVSFYAWQDLLETHFYRPVFMWWLDRAVKAGLIPGRADMFQHEWDAPQPAWIDQLAETQAHGEGVDRGFETWSDVQKAKNKNPDAQRAALIAEEVAAWEACNEVEKATNGEYRPAPERFLGRKPPEGATKTATTEPEDKPAPDPAEPQKPVPAQVLNVNVPATVVHNHVAPADVSVEAPQAVVVPAPEVTVAAAPAPVVNVQPAITVTAPDVNVTTPAPVVNVEAPSVNVAAPVVHNVISTPARKVVLERDAEGRLLGGETR